MILISLRGIDTAIGKNKASSGTNEVHAYLLKFSGPVFRNLLAKIFNAFLSHKYVPAAMIRSKIKPVIKKFLLVNVIQQIIDQL